MSSCKCGVIQCSYPICEQCVKENEQLKARNAELESVFDYLENIRRMSERGLKAVISDIDYYGDGIVTTLGNRYVDTFQHILDEYGRAIAQKGVGDGY
jgi:hypothetical protein